MNIIRVAICGYGNLGKGVEKEIPKSKDMELVVIFTRRNPKIIKTKSLVPVVKTDDMENWKDKVDVVIMCGGSATDLPIQVPKVAKFFNTVDSFDTHSKIPEYFEKVNESARNAQKTSIISGGWDPGMFSVIRTYADSIINDGNTYTFWGKGVSQGHSDAIRRLPGVKDARQYTIPIESAVESVRKGENPKLTTGQKHLRECFVVAKEGIELNVLEEKIKKMPNYFSNYKTIVHFISEEELMKNHNKLPHGGFVICTGKTGDGNNQIMEYSLKLDSNPEFTASVLIMLARANYRLNKMGQYGAKTMLDIPPAMLSKKSLEELRRKIL